MMRVSRDVATPDVLVPSSAPRTRRRFLFWAIVLGFVVVTFGASAGETTPATVSGVARYSERIVLPGVLLAAVGAIWGALIGRTTIALFEDTSARSRWTVWRASVRHVSVPSLIAGLLVVTLGSIPLVASVISHGLEPVRGVSAFSFLSAISVVVRPVALGAIGVFVGRQIPRPWAPLLAVGLAYGITMLAFLGSMLLVAEQQRADALAFVGALQPVLPSSTRHGIVGAPVVVVGLTSMMVVSIGASGLMPEKLPRLIAVPIGTAGLMASLIVGLVMLRAGDSVWEQASVEDFECAIATPTEVEVCAAVGATHLLPDAANRVGALLAPLEPALTNVSVKLVADNTDAAIARLARSAVASSIFVACDELSEESFLLPTIISEKVVAGPFNGPAYSTTRSQSSTDEALVQEASTDELVDFLNTHALEIREDCSVLPSLVERELK